MAATSSCMASTKFSMAGGWAKVKTRRQGLISYVSAQQKADVQETEQVNFETSEDTKIPTQPRPVEKQTNVKSKNLTRDYGGQWLSCATRHVRIYAAYIDPETWEMDQTQLDKLTLLLDTTNEFLWTDEATQKVYCLFQELVDNYEGAPLTEYTLRLIGSDLEHYIRKLLYDGEIKYNMDANQLNFSMGKPRIMFNEEALPQ